MLWLDWARRVGCLLGAVAISNLYACSAPAATDATARPPMKAARPPEEAAQSAATTSRPAATTSTAIAARLATGRQTVEAFFGRGFPRPYEVHVLPGRAAFNQFVKERWGMPQTECWMVAAGTGGVLVTIDPAAWKTDACEHDPADERHVQQLLTHELVHVFHGQHNPRPEFDGMDDVGWFVEGLAVYASGQLDDARRREAREAIEKCRSPARLEEAWSGRYRYAVCGSLVAFVDERLGRDKLVGLLSATREEEILAALGMSEAELLDAWRARERGGS